MNVTPRYNTGMLAGDAENLCDMLDESEARKAELVARIADLETALKKWRDHYQHVSDGLAVVVPVYQIEALVGPKL